MQFKLVNYSKIVIANYSRFYYLGELLHRIDGPAVEWYDGDCWYYLNGNMYIEKEDYYRIIYVLENGLDDYE